ncbi:MAG: hypothetical protein HN392_01560 [Anaerolineae bacterium]|jgi:hypothetical protein|nr:hypothetical protein [Anaerolineae bacterium]MBT7074154.1 hypothetical protein [Anaerolineae bacterium]MBT7781786.1 hypothetical protein [Anaerolineae bacterium]
MTEEKNPLDELAQLRAEQLEEAPTLGKAKKAGQEIKVRRSPWILRSLMLLLVAMLVSEFFLINRYRKESLQIVVQNPPMVKSYSAPEVSAPLPAPPVESADIDDFVEEPPVVPLPPELDGIDISVPVEE